MKQKTIYAEVGFPGTLVPVMFIAWARTPMHDVTGLYNAVVRLKKSFCGYTRNEIVHLPAHAVVVKAGVRNYHQLVRPAELPARTPENTITARV